MPVKHVYTAQMKTPIPDDFRKRNEDFAASLMTAVRDGTFPSTFKDIWCPKASLIYGEMNGYFPPEDDDVFIYNLVDGMFRSAAKGGRIPDSAQIIALAQPLEDASRAADEAAAAAAASAAVAPKTKGRPPAKKSQAAKQKEEKAKIAKEEKAKVAKEEKARLAKEEAAMARAKAAQERADRAKEREERELQGLKPTQDQQRSNAGGRVKKEKLAPVPAVQANDGDEVPMEVDADDERKARQDELNALIGRIGELEQILNITESPEGSKSQEASAPARKRKRADNSDPEGISEVPKEGLAHNITALTRTETRTTSTTAKNAVEDANALDFPVRRGSATKSSHSDSRLAPVRKAQPPTDSPEAADQDSDDSDEWEVRRPRPHGTSGRFRGCIQSEEGSDADADEDAGYVHSIVNESNADAPGDQHDEKSPLPSQSSDNGDGRDLADPAAHPEVKARRAVTFAPAPTEAPEVDAATKRQHARECPMPDDPKEDDVLPQWVSALFACERCKQAGANCYINIAHSTRAKATSRACGFCSSGKHRCSHATLAINMVSLLDTAGVHSFIENVANDIIVLKEEVRNLLEMKTVISSVLENMVTAQDFAGFRQEAQEAHNRLLQDMSNSLSAVRTAAQPVRKQQRPSPSFTFRPSGANALLTTPVSTTPKYTPAPPVATSLTARQGDSAVGSAVLAGPLLPVRHSLPEPEPPRQRWSMSPVTDINRIPKHLNDSVSLPVIPEHEGSQGTHEMDGDNGRATHTQVVAFEHPSPSSSTDGTARPALTDHSTRPSVARATLRSDDQPHLLEDVPVTTSGVVINANHQPLSTFHIRPSSGVRPGASWRSVSREQTISPLMVSTPLTAVLNSPHPAHTSVRSSPVPRSESSGYPLRGESTISLLKVPQSDMQLRVHHSSIINDPFPRRNGQTRTVSTDDTSSSAMSGERMSAASHSFQQASTVTPHVATMMPPLNRLASEKHRMQQFEDPSLNNLHLTREPVRAGIVDSRARPLAESQADPHVRYSRDLTDSPPLHQWSTGAAFADDDTGADGNVQSAIVADLDLMPVDGALMDIGTEHSFD